MKLKWAMLVSLALVLLIGVVGCAGQMVLGTSETPTPTPQATPKTGDSDGGGGFSENLPASPRNRAWLGITLEAVEDGVRVAAVTPASPADKAGVKKGDVIMWMDGNRVRREDDIIGAMEEVRVGEQVALTVRRDGQELDITVTAGERPVANGVLAAGGKSTLEEWLSLLPMLKDVKPEDHFQHFVGGQFTVVDKNGQEVVLTVIAGRLRAVSAENVTVELNKPGAGSDSFRISDSTIIWEGSGKGTIGDLSIGDRVLVVTKDGSKDALAVVKVTGSRPGLRLPDPSSIPGWDELRQRLRDLGVPDVLVPDPNRDYDFAPR